MGPAPRQLFLFPIPSNRGHRSLLAPAWMVSTGPSLAAKAGPHADLWMWRGFSRSPTSARRRAWPCLVKQDSGRFPGKPRDASRTHCGAVKEFPATLTPPVTTRPRRVPTPGRTTQESHAAVCRGPHTQKKEDHMSIDREKYRKKCKHFNGTIHEDLARRAWIMPRYVGDGKFIQRCPAIPSPRTRRQWARLWRSFPARSSRATRKPTSTPSRPVLPPAGNGMRRFSPLIMWRIRRENKGRSNQGNDPCPACGTGTFHWSIAGYNGHMRGQCTTKGCVNFIE